MPRSCRSYPLGKLTSEHLDRFLGPLTSVQLLVCEPEVSALVDIEQLRSSLVALALTASPRDVTNSLFTAFDTLVICTVHDVVNPPRVRS